MYADRVSQSGSGCTSADRSEAWLPYNYGRDHAAGKRRHEHHYARTPVAGDIHRPIVVEGDPAWIA